MISHEVKELGTHILVCEVTYCNAAGEKLNFRKFFKFQVIISLRCLEISQGQCGIKCLVGCDHKNKTKMVCENLMHNRGYRGDIIHKILGLLFSNALKWYSFRKKHAIFITFWGEGVQHPKAVMIDAFF